MRPVTGIQKAEENQISALVNPFTRYGLEVPENEWLGNVPSFDTLAAACAAGAQAQEENAGLYDELFEMADNGILIQVFAGHPAPLEMRHLPAFARCAPYGKGRASAPGSRGEPGVFFLLAVGLGGGVGDQEMPGGRSV